MLYTLPNGKTIYLTTEEYFSLSDQDIQELVAMNWGEQINHPFFGSVIRKRPKPDPVEVPLDCDPEDDESFPGSQSDEVGEDPEFDEEIDLES